MHPHGNTGSRKQGESAPNSGNIPNENNLDLADERFADDYVGRFLSEPHHGPEGVKEVASMVRTAFPDIEATVEDVIAEGDTVGRRDRVTGTHEGEFVEIEPTGEEIEIKGIVILRVEDGQFVESWGHGNTYELVQQLGVVEPPTGRGGLPMASSTTKKREQWHPRTHPKRTGRSRVTSPRKWRPGATSISSMNSAPRT